MLKGVSGKELEGMRKIVQSISTKIIITNIEPLLYVRKTIGNRIPRHKSG